MNSSLLLLPLLPLFSENEKFALIENVKKLKVQQERDICRLVGLPVRGVKNDLLNRLIQHIEARYALRQYPELLAFQTLVLKLLYNSPLPDYSLLVTAIRTGSISAGSVASLLEQFQMALSMATLSRLANMAANGPINNTVANNNTALAPNSNYTQLSPAERAIYLANQNSQMANLNGVNGLGNSAQMHLNAMGRTIGGMTGLRQDMPHSNSIGHMVGMGGQAGGAGMGRSGELESLYLGPMLLFKSTIFYLLRKLVGTPQVLRASKGRNIKSFRLKLHSSEIKLLKESPNMKLYIFSGTESTQDHTNTPIQFPPIEIYVDDALTKQHTKGIKGKPGSARPADLTPYFTLFDRAILVRVVYSDALEKYIFYTYIVEEIPLEQLSKDIESKPHIPTYATRAAIQKENEAGGDDDEDIVVATSSLSLRCPLTYARLKQPVRSIHCDHIQCFDGPSFLSMQQKIPLWQCPVCSAYIDQHSLAVSDYITEILNSTPDSVDSVILNPDGLWHAIEGETLLDSDDEDTPLNKVALKPTKEELIARDEPIEIISLDTDSEPEDNATLQPAAQPSQPQQPQPQSQRQKASFPQPAAPPSSQPADTTSINPYIQPPLQANSNSAHVHSTDVIIPGHEPRRLENAENSEKLKVAENGKRRHLSRLESLQAAKNSMSKPEPPLPLNSDSPLSPVPALLAVEGPLPSLNESQNMESEDDDEDAVIARPRRRAIVTDASDNEASRPASAIPTENQSQLARNDNGKIPKTGPQTSASLTPIMPQKVPQVSQPGVQATQSINEPAQATISLDDSRSLAQSVADGPNFQREPHVAPQEAIFMRTMRQFSQMPANVNPFVNGQQQDLNRGVAMHGGTQNTSAISVDSTTESPEPIVENGTQYINHPGQTQALNMPHLVGQSLPLHGAIHPNMVLPLTNQDNDSRAAANSLLPNSMSAHSLPTHSLPAHSALSSAIRNSNNPRLASLAEGQISTSPHLHSSYSGLPGLGSNVQMIGNVYGNQMYQRMINESRAKINAYMQMKDPNAEMMSFLPSVRPNAANGNVLEPNMAPTRAHSTSILNQHLGSALCTNPGAQDKTCCPANPCVAGPWTTPTKRNNSVPSKPQQIEATIASPREDDATNRAAKSQVQLDTLLNRSAHERSKNSAEGVEENNSIDIDRVEGAVSNTTSNKTSTTAGKELLTGESGAGDSNKNENIGATNKNSALVTSPKASGSTLAENISTSGAAADVPQQPPQQLFVSPMGSAILDLVLTTPLNRKRPSADNSDAQRLWNKKVNQSPSSPIATLVQNSGSSADSGVFRNGKAKFDPSKIDQADIIELD